MNVSRREFLLCSGASAIATMALPVRAELRPLVLSPIRDGNAREALCLSELEIDVGATAPFRVLHVSDSHLNLWDVADIAGDQLLGEKFARRWVRFPQAVNSFCALLDYAEANRLPILHTGDLMDSNTAANTRFASRSLKCVDFFYAIGNHEYQLAAGDPDPAACRARLRQVVGNDLTVASRIVNGINFVAYDNGMVNLRPETVERVKSEFARGLPVVLLCHVPPKYTEKFLDNSLESKRQTLRGQGAGVAEIARIARGRNIEEAYDATTSAFYVWLRQQRQLKAILCGHTHVEEDDVFSETARMYVAGGGFEGRGRIIAFR